MNENRLVKGMFIPIEIWESKDLTWNEKILFLEIDSFTSKDKDCYISDEYIAELLGLSITRANKVLSSLIKKGYVVKTKFDGRRRFVKTALTFSTSQPCPKRQGCLDIFGNIPNNIITDDNLPKKENNKKKCSRVKQNEWRANIDVYKAMVNEAKETVLNDEEFKKQFMFMYPNCDYYRTVLTSANYWCSESGWEHKKKSKKDGINMVSTIKNNLDKNIVFKNPNNEPIENLTRLNVSTDASGRCEDGTFIRGAYRYYHSQRDNKDYSIPIDAPRMPDERWEFDLKKNTWELPQEKERLEDWIW